VDTSDFYALLVRGDRMHARSKMILADAAGSGRRFVTTDYVREETVTLLKARGLGHLVPALFERVFTSQACRIEWMNPERFDRARHFFLKPLDQAWSFTDCFSFTLMRDLGFRDSLSTDDHFRHSGFQSLLV
jgi:hypothetical protein